MSIIPSSQQGSDRFQCSPSFFTGLDASGANRSISIPSTRNGGLDVSFFIPSRSATPPQIHPAAQTTLRSMQHVEPVSKGFCSYLADAWQSVVNCFWSFLSWLGLVKPDPESFENHLKGDAEIAQAMQRQLQRNAEQMAREPIKTFQYQAAPATWEMHEERIGHVPVGIAHAQGRRPTMEDEHIAAQFNVQVGQRAFPIQLFGIFDGHGGPMAARYVRDHLQGKLSEALVEYNPNGLTDAGIWRALKMTSVRLNQDFKVQHPEIAQRQGTTATIAMILDHKLWTANVGDARTILDNNGTAEQLTEDAKPDDPRYRRGIERRGGTVFNMRGVPRVNGILAVARAIGDHRLNGAISARPKIAMKPLSDIQPGSHLVLCCDGIYDVARTVDVARAAHLNRALTPGALARNIIFSAHESGSTDNLSALVVKVR